MKEELREAIQCCRMEDCEHCPMQEQICDELIVEMESIPAELMDMIEEELNTKQG